MLWVKRLAITVAVAGFSAAALGYLWSPKPEDSAGGKVEQAEAESAPADPQGSDPKRFVDCGKQTTELLRTACRVGSAAEVLASYHDGAELSRDEAFNAFATVEAANVVRASLSSARYAYLGLNAQQRLPQNSESCLEESAGICGNHILVFREIMSALGIETRPLSFFYTIDDGERASRAAVEVFYEQAWRFVDGTWGFVMARNRSLKFAGFEEIRTSKDLEPVENDLDAWSLFVRSRLGSPLDYISRPDLNVLVDGKGVVTVSVPEEPESIERFEHIPNYVGDTTSQPESRPTSLRYLTDRRYRVSLQIATQAGCQPQEGDRLLVNGREFSIAGPSLSFDMDRDAMLSMHSQQQTCYVAFSEARFAALP